MNNNFAKINIVPAINCSDINCKSIEHRHEIDTFYSQICNALQSSTSSCIPSSKSSDSREYILVVHGFNNYVKDLHSTARAGYVVWGDTGKPRSGALCSNMRSSRLKFKYALRQCKDNEDAIRSDQYAKSFLEKDMPSFWKNIRKHNSTKVPLATTIYGVTDECNIADMWQDHYKSILNSMKKSSQKHFLTDKINSIEGESFIFFYFRCDYCT